MSDTTSILHEIKSTASSSYVVHYHMTREPFAEAIEVDLFYAEPDRQQKLDILLHLTRYGNELVFVAGPLGSGKTTLLQQYLSRILDSWIVVHIDAQGGIDERKLLQQLFHQMNLDFQGATHSELFERMQHHFDTVQRNAMQAILLIDNAEQLAITALKRVLEMAALTNADGKPLLRIILFGTRKLDENFHDSLLGMQTHIVRRNIDLLPFSQIHTTHYILHRLSAASFAADKPFTDAVLQKIHKQSIGWPGEINRLAHDVLIESLPTVNGTPSINKIRTVTALVGVALLSALLFFQDEFNAWFTPGLTVTTSQPPLVSLPVAEPVAIPNEEVFVPMEVPMVTVVDEPGPPSSPGIVEENAEIATPAPENLERAISDTATLSPTLTVAPLIEKKERERVSLPVDIAILSTAKTSPIPADLPGFRSAWILEQNPEHYTLQLVAGNNINTLRSFIRQHPLDEPLAIYHTTRKGKAWFGLVQRSYPNKQTALEARRQLSPALRQQNPWLRQFSALQKDLAPVVAN